MNRNLLRGFDEIKADGNLLTKTKGKMRAALASSPQPEQTKRAKQKAFYTKRKTVLASISFLMIAAFAAMAFWSGRPWIAAAKAQDLMAGVTPQNVNITGDAITEDFKKSAQNFSVNLFKQTFAGGRNALVSPASAVFALGMTANGAAGDTQKEFINVLGKYGMMVDDLNKAYKACSGLLTEKTHGSTSLQIANSIWFRSGFKVKQPFLQTNATYFGAGARALDFDNPNSKNTINDWVKINTNGKIEKMVNEIEPDTVMYLINALSFDAKWQLPFDTAVESRHAAFYLEDGSTASAPYMYLIGPLDYIKGKTETAVLLPYDDGRFAFLCILPNSGIKLNDYLNSMTEDTLPDLMSQKAETEISVTLPRFKAAFDYNLNDALKNMGLASAFDRRTANFSEIKEGNDPLYISSVRQKTFLQVDELGTQAGASTSVEMKEDMVLEMEDIIFNRPFIYAVIDKQTDLPLFLGAMENPQQQ